MSEMKGKQSMPRPKKCRRVCSIPQCTLYGPLHQITPQSTPVQMSVDELETIRIIDHLGCTQEDCAQQMGVARTTVQAIYTSARQKLADALINAKPLSISGGDYTLCQNFGTCCRRIKPGHPCPHISGEHIHKHGGHDHENRGNL